jgi:CheY-like chemotaxis protein
MAYILMIDDNPRNQRYIQRIIYHRSAHQIGIAGSSNEAIEQLVSGRPDVIFLDLYIPGMDGFDFFDTIKQHPATGAIPIVILSAVPLDPIARIHLRRMVFEGFIGFPIEASAVNQIIDAALTHNNPAVPKWRPPAV